MSVTYHKLFWAFDYQKEEDWINRMSENGLQLIDPGLISYTFNEGEKGEYQYRLEMLPHFPYHEESRKYIKFVKDTGAEYIGSVKNWVYFRKKTSEGPFELFNDYSTKIRHFRRIRNLLLCCLFVLLCYPIVCLPSMLKDLVPYPAATVISVDDMDYLVAAGDPREYPEFSFPCTRKDAPYTFSRSDIVVYERLPYHQFNNNLTIVCLSSGIVGDYSPWLYAVKGDSYILRPNKDYTFQQLDAYFPLFFVFIFYLFMYIVLFVGIFRLARQIRYLKKEKRIFQ